MNFVGSFVDIAIGAAGMWAFQTLGWPFIKSWFKSLAKKALNAINDEPTTPTPAAPSAPVSVIVS